MSLHIHASSSEGGARGVQLGAGSHGEGAGRGVKATKSSWKEPRRVRRSVGPGEQDSGTRPRAWKEGVGSQQLRGKEKVRQSSLVCDSEFTRRG